MTKREYKKLSRGVKLLKEHIYTPVSEALQNLTDIGFTATGGVEADQMAQPNAPFMIHLSIPNFDASEESTSIPIVLPPFQSDISWATGQQSQTSPPYFVNEIGFSFDQRDETAGIRSATAITDPNLMDFTDRERYKLEVELVETKQTSYGNTDLAQTRYSTVWSNTISADAWITGLNPQTYSEIGVELKPFRTYFLKLNAPNLSEAGKEDLAMPNLNVWLKCSSPLTVRDRHIVASGLYVQNLPSVSNGQYQAQVQTVTEPPVVGSLISANYDTANADPYDGVQTSVEKVDKLFRNKLKSGYNIHSELPSGENIYHDSGYTVIAVPMFGNFTDDVTETTAGNLPYVGGSPYINPTLDRRIIPLERGFTVHNVFACVNYGATGIIPNSSTLSHYVGVGIGSGFRGDLHTYQQVAGLGWNPDFGAGSYVIDDCSVNVSDTNRDTWRIVSIPLVSVTGQTSNNYGTQGKPFYVGQSRTGTDARTDVGVIGGGSGSTPNTKGLESFLEVRWSIGDVGGLGNLNAGEVIVPHYGNWVYIVGKQTMGTK